MLLNSNHVRRSCQCHLIFTSLPSSSNHCQKLNVFRLWTHSISYTQTHIYIYTHKLTVTRMWDRKFKQDNYSNYTSGTKVLPYLHMHDCSIVKYQSLEEPEQSSAQSIIEFLLDGWRQSVNHSQVHAHTWLSFQCKNKLFQSISSAKKAHWSLYCWSFLHRQYKTLWMCELEAYLWRFRALSVSGIFYVCYIQKVCIL